MRQDNRRRGVGARLWRLGLALIVVWATVGCNADEDGETAGDDTGVVQDDGGGGDGGGIGDGVDHGDEPLPQSDVCGDIKVPLLPIVGGESSPDPSVVTMSAVQQNAVVVTDRPCTGVFVAPNVVLTLASCVAEYDTVTVSVGESRTSPEATFTASEIHLHPDYDDSSAPGRTYPGVLVLDEEVTTIQPIPVAETPTSLVGQAVVAGGYGRTSPGDSFGTQRYWYTLTVSSEDDLTYTASGDGTNGICGGGDAGAPLLWMDETQTLRVMGLNVTLSPADCAGPDGFSRIDATYDWLAGYLPTTDSCDGETLTGRCDGDTAIWCVAGEVQSEDCTDTGEMCGVDADGMYRCLTECEALGHRGDCDGDTARWCQDGEILARDCAACDQACGDTGGSLGFYCL